MSFDFSTLITDRSRADLDALRDMLSTPMSDWTAEQLAAFNQAASRGAYNYTDLNRVTAAMDDLNERLTALGYETGYQRIVVPHQESGDGGLPEGYTQLEYIKSSGTQYIDTGFKPDQNSTLQIKFTFLDDPGTNISGVRDALGDVHNRFGVITFGATSLFGAFYGNLSVPGNVIDDDTHVFSLGPHGFVVDETTYSVSSQTFQLSYNLTLFGFNNGNGGVSCTSMKIYQVSLYDNEMQIRNYIPCINPEGEIGLYDSCGILFYKNVGTGNFLAGPIVLDPYLWYEQDVPTESAMEAYLANVSALRKVLTLPETTAEAPENMNGLTTEEANTIEEILKTIEVYLLAMSKIFLRSGMAWAVSGGPAFYFVN